MSTNVLNLVGISGYLAVDGSEAISLQIKASVGPAGTEMTVVGPSKPSNAVYLYNGVFNATFKVAVTKNSDHPMEFDEDGTKPVVITGAGTFYTRTSATPATITLSLVELPLGDQLDVSVVDASGKVLYSAGDLHFERGGMFVQTFNADFTPFTGEAPVAIVGAPGTIETVPQATSTTTATVAS